MCRLATDPSASLRTGSKIKLAKCSQQIEKMESDNMDLTTVEIRIPDI
jgi:hypothetical protein